MFVRHPPIKVGDVFRTTKHGNVVVREYKSAKEVVVEFEDGARYEEMVDQLDEDQIEILDAMLDDGVLEYASPWYDSDRNYWVVGLEVEN